MVGVSNSVRAVWSNRVIQVGRAVALLLREREFWGLVVASIVLVVLAYQVPFDFALDLAVRLRPRLTNPSLCIFIPRNMGLLVRIGGHENAVPLC